MSSVQVLAALLACETVAQEDFGAAAVLPAETDRMLHITAPHPDVANLSTQGRRWR